VVHSLAHLQLQPYDSSNRIWLEERPKPIWGLGLGLEDMYAFLDSNQ